MKDKTPNPQVVRSVQLGMLGLFWVFVLGIIG